MGCHPDLGGDREEFERIQHAHDILADADRRARYDQTGDSAAEPDNSLSEISSVIIAAFDHVVAKAGVKFREHDLIADTCTALGEHKERMAASLLDAQSEKAKLEELLARLSFDGSGPDILTATLLQRVRGQDAKIRLAERQADLTDQAIAYLGAYGFNWKGGELTERPSAAIDFEAITFTGLTDHEGHPV